MAWAPQVLTREVMGFHPVHGVQAQTAPLRSQLRKE
jgi:hypothetical protein